jgi:serine/threonine-protein kinase RsbW
MHGTAPAPAFTDATLHLPAAIDSVRVARAALTRALRRAGWDRTAAGLVLLAMSEAVVNAVVHGSTTRGEVRVRFAISPNVARVRVVDEGRPGPSGWPAARAELPPEQSTSGRGLYIMQSVADTCDVHSDGDGTEVVLEFLRAA